MVSRTSHKLNTIANVLCSDDRHSRTNSRIALAHSCNYTRHSWYYRYLRKLRRNGRKPSIISHIRYQRHYNDADHIAKLRLEQPSRNFCGITRHEEWPSYAWSGGYDLIYYVAGDVYSARRSSVDGTLCADCLNKDFSHNVVVAVDSSDGYDDPVHCDHCNRNIGSSLIACAICKEWEDYDTSTYSDDHNGDVCLRCATMAHVR